MYDYIIFTHIPAFYKVNLYNELRKTLKIYVVFIANETDEKRSSDFIDKNTIRFEYDILSPGDFQHRNKLDNIKKIKAILKYKRFNKIIVSGWDLIEFWYLIFLVPKQKNCLALESTIMESVSSGIRGCLKKLFLSRIACVFVSGSLQKQLLGVLNYKGEIRITKGVGIINKPSFGKEIRSYSKKYLYVGRLSEEKNLFFLIKVFNALSDYQLTIIGVGPIETELKKLANDNIVFCGQVDNKDLKNVYFDNDLLILPSLREPWGLVVEEALYFGMPVIISDKCGAIELIENGENGYVFDSEAQLKKIILSQNQYTYSQLVKGVNISSVEIKDHRQVEVYL